MVYGKLCIYVNSKEQMAHFLAHFNWVLVSRTATANSVSPKVFQGHRLTHGAGHTLGQRLKIHGINKNQLHVIHFAELSFCILCSGDFAILRCSFGQNSKNIWCWKLGSPRPPPQQPPPRRGEGPMGKWQMENGLAVSSCFVAISHWQQGRLERNEAGGVSIVVMQAGRKTQSCGTFCSSFHVVSFCFCYLRNLNEPKLSFGSERLTRDSPEIVLELLVRFTSWHP